MPFEAEPTLPSRKKDLTTHCAVDLVSSGSLEICAHRTEDVSAIAALVPVGTSVFVNHLPRQSLANSLTAVIAIREAGLHPVPHIAARRVASREELSEFLDKAVQVGGVRRVLLIGGDASQPEGPFPDTQSLLLDGLFKKSGIPEIGLASYPEGHPHVANETLERAFAAKLELIDQQGVNSFAVTQFSFAPGRIVEHCKHLARRYPALPVYVGIAGPGSAKRLLQFAQRCGVSASLRALQAEGMAAVRVVMQTDAGQQLAVIAQNCSQGTMNNVVGVHFFSFGNAAQAAAFMLRTITEER